MASDEGLGKKVLGIGKKREKYLKKRCSKLLIGHMRQL